DLLPEAPWLALVEFESGAPDGLRASIESAFEAAIEAEEAGDVLIAENEAQARAFWALREAIPTGPKPEGAQTNHDISVPVSATPAFIYKAQGEMERICPGVGIVAFGHMGDGNIHYTLVQPEGADPAQFPKQALDRAVNETAIALDGSISAEHGIGVTRLGDFTRFKDPEAIALMRAVKAALDPKRVMNPRVMLP